MRRLVYRKTNDKITPIQYTNQIFEDDEWKFVNRYTGKFGARPIVWYATKEWAEKFMKHDDEVAEMVEWNGIDEEGYKNVFTPPSYESIH